MRPGMPPKRIDHYRIERTLAMGGMGAVYLATDERLERLVAIKGLIGDDVAPDRRERLRREALATAALSHPAIAHVYEIVTSEGRDWVVMEYIEGQTLADVVARGPANPAEVMRIGEEIAGALAEAHRHGIVHRDVKLENVMVTPRGDVKVLDFGLALRLGEGPDAAPRLTSDGMVVGTARAMSPEQAVGKGSDIRSDVFALGSLLLELSTGKPAFEGAGPADVMVKVARNERPPVHRTAPHLPVGLAAVIERCMATRPEDRYATAGEVIAALRRLSEPTGATEVIGRSARVHIATRTSRRLLIAGGTAVATIAMLVVIGVRAGWFSPRPPLTVAVLPVEAPASAGELRLARAAVADGIASKLARLPGLSVVSGREVRVVATPGRSPVEVAAMLGVRELVRPTIAAGPGAGRAEIALSRIDGGSGNVLWSARLEVGTEDPLLIEDRIATALTDAYRDVSQGESSADRGVTPAALSAFLEAQSRLDAGKPSPGYADEIALLDRAVALSPRFLRALTTLASIHRYLFERDNDAAQRELAERVLTRAEAVDASNPGVLRGRIELADAEGDIATALERARRLVAARPGSDEAWRQLGYAQKEAFHLADAINSFERAYALRPTWQPLVGEADARKFSGDYERARRALDRLDARWPENLSALRKRGEVEMYAGDFRAGEALCRRVHDRTGTPSDLINVANCEYFEGRFLEAASGYREAAAAAPANPLPLANLADAELAAGDTATARSTYARALVLCDRQLASGRRTRIALFSRARCLAQLDRSSEAQLTIEEALRRFPGNPETTFMAALVAALGGNRTSCIAWTRQSLTLHAPPAWFGGPEFATMRREQAFAALFPGGAPVLGSSSAGR
jgi:eukaryotic-like serine/threonine-protein kinase